MEHDQSRGGRELGREGNPVCVTFELAVEIRELDVNDDDQIYLGLGYVSSSDPGEGERVAKGSTITLSVV